MNSSYLKLFFLFLMLVLAQVLILNHIFVLSHATPFLYIYILLKLPAALNKNIVIVLGFLVGFTIDIFCNTPGLNAAATTFAAFMRDPIQRLFFDKDELDQSTPKLLAVSGNLIRYTVVMILIHHATLISLEYFSYFNAFTILLRIILSSLLTFIVIFAIERFSIKKKRT